MISDKNKIERVKEIIISPRMSVGKALEIMDKSGLGILLVCKPDRCLIGVITDGDVRRYLLHNHSLDVKVSELMNRNFLSIKESEKDAAYRLLETSKINHVPVLNSRGRIIDIILALDFIKIKKQHYENPVVIMAGGKGDRLSPLTKIIPKPLIPAGEKTMIEMIMDNFRQKGFHDFHIIVNYKKELIKSYFEENNLNRNVKFIEEHDFLGTAGSLGLLKGMFEKSFILSNCDIIATIDYGFMLEWHREHNADLTILGVRRKMDVPYGVVNVNEENYVVKITEKPHYTFMILSGIYIIEPSVIEGITDNSFLGMDKLIEQIITSGKNVTCYPIENGWLDIGQFSGYKKLLKQFGVIGV